MADLIGTEVAKNYQKVAPSSMFGTRELMFLKVTVDNAGTAKVDFTKQGTNEEGNDYVGTYLEADSYLSRAIRALQGFAELFFIGEPNVTSFIVAVSSDTLNEGSDDDLSYIKNHIAGSLGVGKKTGSTPTLYNGAVEVTVLKAVGGEFVV